MRHWNGDAFVPFRSVWTASVTSCLPFCLLALASRLESMLFHRHLLLNSAGTLYYCCCSISSVFCNCSSSGITFSYRRSIELVPLIRSRLPPNVIAWLEQHSFQLSWTIQASNSCQLRFAESTARSVTYRRRARSPFNFRFFCVQNGGSFPFRRNETER